MNDLTRRLVLQGGTALGAASARMRDRRPPPARTVGVPAPIVERIPMKATSASSDSKSGPKPEAWAPGDPGQPVVADVPGQHPAE